MPCVVEVIIEFTVFVVVKISVDVNVGLVGYMSADIGVRGVGDMTDDVTDCVDLNTAVGMETNGEVYIAIDRGVRDAKYTADDTGVSGTLKDEIIVGIILVAAECNDFDMG